MDATDYLAVLIVTDSFNRKTSEAFSVAGYRESLGEKHDVWISEAGEPTVRGAFDKLALIGLMTPIVTPHAATRFQPANITVFTLRDSNGPFEGSLLEAADLYRSLGKEWLVESLKNALEGKSIDDGWVPPVEAAWSPLALERPDPELDALAEQIANLSQLVRSDNGYAHDETGERDDVLARLKAGVDYLRNASILTSSALTIYVSWPLERLVAKFGPAAIGVASKVALELFTSWLKKMASLS